MPEENNPIPQMPATPTPEPSMMPQTPTPSPEPEQPKKSPLTKIIIALVVLALGALAYYFLGGSGLQGLLKLSEESRIDGLEEVQDVTYLQTTAENFPLYKDHEAIFSYTGEGDLTLEYPDDLYVAWYSPNYVTTFNNNVATVNDLSRVSNAEVDHVCIAFAIPTNPADQAAAYQCLTKAQIDGGQTFTYDYNNEIRDGHLNQQIEIYLYDQSGHILSDFKNDAFTLGAGTPQVDNALVTIPEEPTCTTKGGYQKDNYGAFITLNNLGDYKIENINWDFGDEKGTNYNHEEIFHKYADFGQSYEIGVLIEALSGRQFVANCSFTMPELVPDFTFVPSEGDIALEFADRPFNKYGTNADQICADFGDQAAEECISIADYNSEIAALKHRYDDPTQNHNVTVSIKDNKDVTLAAKKQSYAATSTQSYYGSHRQTEPEAKTPASETPLITVPESTDSSTPSFQKVEETDKAELTPSELKAKSLQDQADLDAKNAALQDPSQPVFTPTTVKSPAVENEKEQTTPATVLESAYQYSTEETKAKDPVIEPGSQEEEDAKNAAADKPTAFHYSSLFASSFDSGTASVSSSIKTSDLSVPADNTRAASNKEDVQVAPGIRTKTIPTGSYIYIQYGCEQIGKTYTFSRDGKKQTFTIEGDVKACNKTVESSEKKNATFTQINQPKVDTTKPSPKKTLAGTIAASCNVNTLSPELDETVFFDGDGSSTFDKAIWDFGDGTVLKLSAENNDGLDQEHIYHQTGTYNAHLTVVRNDASASCSKQITVTSGPAPTQCSDGIDNDGDGLIDMNFDPGCDSYSDNSEANGVFRVKTACSDGIDNDGDGFIDTSDIGCQSAGDDNENNPQENVLPGGDAKQQACLEQSLQDITFTDTTANYAEDVILDFANTIYSGEDSQFDGTPLIQGYTEDSGRTFKPYRPIRRDEALKILAITSCFVEYVDVNDTEFDFTDPEFKNEDYWAKTVINRAANGGLIKKSGKMHPEQNVTRAEFMKMIALIDHQIRGTEIQECQSDDDVAVDVRKKDWFCRYAKTVQALDIAGGTKDIKGNLRLYPNSILTRGDAIIWLNNYLSIISK